MPSRLEPRTRRGNGAVPCGVPFRATTVLPVDSTTGVETPRAGSVEPSERSRFAQHTRVHTSPRGVQVLRTALGTCVREIGPSRTLATVQSEAAVRRAAWAPIRDGDTPARTARGLRRSGRVHRVNRMGRDPGARAR